MFERVPSTIRYMHPAQHKNRQRNYPRPAVTKQTPPTLSCLFDSNNSPVCYITIIIFVVVIIIIITTTTTTV
jgi:hypothetical protein